LDSLYKSYFEDGQPPASKETLLKAARDGGLNETEVARFLESGEDRMTVKNAIRRTNGEIDGVPHIVVCGFSPRTTDSQGENETLPSLELSKKRNICRPSFKWIRNSIEKCIYIRIYNKIVQHGQFRRPKQL
jgi:hypothetical protein